MKNTARLILAGSLLWGGSLAFSQAPSTTTPQDVPKQQAPGTNNPDISKQRRPAPDSSQGNTSDQHSSDVPNQEPGTNSPDIAKQRAADKSGPAGASNDDGKSASAKSGKKKSKSNKNGSTSKS